MVFNNNYSDYGSGNSSNDSSMSFGGPEKWSAGPQQQSRPKQKSSSYVDLVMGRCTIEDVMQEFRMNGSDSPYAPDDDRTWTRRADDLIGMGPSSAYLRQKSWPDPERTPAIKLPRPASEWLPSATEFTTSTPVEGDRISSQSGVHLRQKSWPDPERASAIKLPRPASEWLSSATEFTTSTPVEEEQPHKSEAITSEQLRVLSSLPNNVLYTLLRELEHGRGEETRPRPKRHPEECRFCKNNGERESYYRSHSLKDNSGRVACPVLRAFVCKRCGASGDNAHTIKYCPLSTNEERIKSAAMMRSVRLASGRRRTPAPRADYIVYDAAPFAIQDSQIYSQYGDAAPLDPLWAALEQKLML